MKTLYLVRHGRTQWNEARRMQGRLDSPLTAAGREHARAHGELLVRERIQRLIVSPLGRTRETAAIANAELGAPVQFDERLMERHCGDWGGLTTDEVNERYPEAWAERQRDPYHARPPGGENVPDMLGRVSPFLETLADLGDERVALVSHAVMGRAILTHFLDLDPPRAAAVAQPNDVIYQLDFAEGRIECRFFHAGVGPQPGTYPVSSGS